MNKNILSLAKLKEMQENGVVFYTAGGRRELRIAEVNEANRTIRMRRSTGRITGALKYDKIEEVYNLIEKGELDLDYKTLDEIAPFWGNYLTGLLTHLGCR
ncbi:MAG: hypothetical protein NUK65_02595 [Firmicutes bacterium]|nr:hypothetical protein [Bacillota bacterium]